MSFVGWRCVATKPSCSIRAFIADGSGLVNSTNSKPSRPMGFSGVMVMGLAPRVTRLGGAQERIREETGAGRRRFHSCCSEWREEDAIAFQNPSWDGLRRKLWFQFRAKMKQTSLDEVDRRLLRLLQDDASLSHAALAEKAGSSPASCWRRIRALEEAGVLRSTVR